MSRRGAGSPAAPAGGSCRVQANSASTSLSRPEASGSSSGESAEPSESRFELIHTPALGRPIVDLARRLLCAGLTSAEVCSLFTQTASVLARQEDGLGDGEWLALCAEFEGQDDVESDARVTAPGGSA